MESVRRFAAERRKSISALVSPFFESNPQNGEYAINSSSCSFPDPFSADRPSLMEITPPASPTVPLRPNNGRRRYSPHRRFSVAPSVLLRKEKIDEDKSKEKMEKDKRRRFSALEDYLPSQQLQQPQQSQYGQPTVQQHHKSSSQLFSPAAAAASSASSPAIAAHYSVIKPATTRPRVSSTRSMRVVVVGAKRVGKTAILRQVACIEDITKKPYSPTIEDTYQVLLEDGDKPREILIFHDSAGLPDHGSSELKRAYLNVADAFVLVYNVHDHESFNRIDQLKKTIDKHYAKEKKEMPIVVLGNMTDLPGVKKVDSEFALNWSQREKVRLFEVTATDRNSLIDFVHYIGQRHFHPTKESKFSLSKKLKSEKSNNAILMDF